jgi:hypothetical protein
MLNSTTTNATNATVVEWDFIEAPLHGLGVLSDRFQERILALAEVLRAFISKIAVIEMAQEPGGVGVTVSDRCLPVWAAAHHTAGFTGCRCKLDRSQ